jgi:hypothetical protein
MSTNEPRGASERESALTTAARILKSLAVAGMLYLLLSVGVSLYMGTHAEKAAPPAPEPPEPVYRDEYGNRIREADYMEKAGFERAKAGSFNRHANCLALEDLMQRGCHRYVTQHNIPPHVPQGNFDSGKTTAECLREVDAYWQAVIDDMRKQGQNQAAEVWSMDFWAPERQQCYAYDTSLASRRQNVKPPESNSRD